mgnify:CR=1 FL=1
MRRNLLRKEEDNDPMSVVSNLFDVAMVFAVALMVALVSRYSMTEMFSQEDFTMVKNPGKENMEIITKEGEKIDRYTPSEDTSSQSGKKGKKVASPMSWKTEKSFTFRKNNLHTVIHMVSKKQTGRKIIRPIIFSACLLFSVTAYFD